ncbi:MAG: CotH kinase family protein [Spirochaetaceae bacterium]|jgi:spore coat protein H|nr:CotH kinase family protein [Spirochaetaceae bacterium]
MQKILFTLLILIVLFQSCDLLVTEKESETVLEIISESIETPDWTEETHGNDVEPNYDVVFSQNEVLEFNIVIDSEYWDIMQADLEENLGQSTVGLPPGRAAVDDLVSEVSDFDPIWVPCSFQFEGLEWYKVGIRFKGNSSLMSAYNSGIEKLSFKLDFDEFEDEYPDIKNQRFYGFNQLNLNNNFGDQSLMREKVGADLFRDFGLVSSQTTFCFINVDYGEGSQYFGVYALVEEMDDSTIQDQLGDDSGNLYKPDGDAASFALGTYEEGEFEKKNNEDEADYSDVLALYDIINRDDRESDQAGWMADLEGVFNVDGFLKWLAANTVMQNWDTYGNMTHNYYLYNNPETGLLNWIPWDNNEALQDGKGTIYSLDLEQADDSWPLIRYLIDISSYRDIYHGYVQQFVDEVFNISEMQSSYSSYYTLLKDYAYAEEPGFTFLSSDSGFDTAVYTLKDHVEERNSAVDSYLGN